MNLIRIDPSSAIGALEMPRIIVEGTPRTGAANAYSDPSGQFHCGIWQSSPGKWKITYIEHEFCVILSGRAVLTNEAGARIEVAAGDAFVIPAGFKGTWETLSDIRKYYAIFEPSGT
jgi:uncharacterized cupin superfamily protein